MSLPLGGGGVSPDDWWLHADGAPDQKVSAMATGRTQAAFEGVYKPKVQASSPWHVAQGIWNTFAAGVSGAATNAINALTMLGTLIWKVGGSIIDDVGDALNAARANAQTALTNAGHALGQLGSLIGKVGGSIIDDVGDALNAARANAQTALANAGISLAGLQNFLDALGSAFGGATHGNDVATVAAQSIEVAQAAQRAEASAYAAQLAVAALSKNLDSAHDGAVFDMTFTGVDGAVLNAADWPTIGPATGDLCIRTINGTPTMGIRAGAPSNATYYAGCGHIYETDDQSLAVIIAGGNSDAPTTLKLHFHCDGVGPAATRGLYLEIMGTGVKLGYFTTTGGVRTYTAFGGNGTVATPLSSGMRVETRNVGNAYQIVLNGSAQPTYVDTANKAVAGDFHAFVTIDRMTKVWNAGTPWQTDAIRDAFYLAGVLMSDYAPIAYKASGARMYRTSTANVGVSAGSNILANNVFSVNGGSSDDIAVDLPTGKFTVTRSDWYYVTFHLALTASSDGGSGGTGVGYNVTPFPMQMAIYKNGSFEKYVGDSLRAYVTTVGITGGGNTININAVGPDVAFGTTLIYLNAGDYIQIGTNATSADTSTFTGEAAGTRTYFEIMGANP